MHVIVLTIMLAMAVVCVVYGIMIYNHLVSLKHGVTKHWSNIDVLLKQRHDELPKLVQVCQQHMTYEQDTLTAITQARANVAKARESGNIGALGTAETALRQGLGQLFAVVENYPELTASQSFQHLIVRVTDLEEAIADRREEYNESVNALNVRIEQFPDSLIATRKGFKAGELLTFQKEEIKDVNVKELFN
jgi:LemA protein